MQTPTINPERLAEIQTLSEGSHDDIERGMSTATEAAAARGIRVEPLPQPDEWGNTWQAVIPRKGRGTLLPMAATLAGTAEDAARAALQYVGARGWQA